MRAPRTGSVVGLLMVAALCAGCAQDEPRDVSAGAKSSRAPSSEPSETPAPGPLRRCAPDDLEPRVVQSGSVGSAPFVTVALRNDGNAACRVSGYPRVGVAGVGTSGRTGVLAVREERGPIYERTDPGLHVVRLLPGESAVFHVGTATAYDVGGQTITRLRVRLPGRLQALTVPVHLDASRPVMRRIPLGVTALQHEDDAQS